MALGRDELVERSEKLAQEAGQWAMGAAGAMSALNGRLNEGYIAPDALNAQAALVAASSSVSTAYSMASGSYSALLAALGDEDGA